MRNIFSEMNQLLGEGEHKASILRIYSKLGLEHPVLFARRPEVKHHMAQREMELGKEKFDEYFDRQIGKTTLRCVNAIVECEERQVNTIFVITTRPDSLTTIVEDRMRDFLRKLKLITDIKVKRIPSELVGQSDFVVLKDY